LFRDLRRHVGQFVMVGFGGTSIPVELRALAREFDLGGVVLFKRNVAEPAQVAELAYEASQLAATPLWVAVDQEGGRVARFRDRFTEWPPMATLGRARDRNLVDRFARALARELKAVGVTLDFAPVLDVATNPRNPVIGDRALSDDAAVVADYGRAIITALQSEGIAACAKHFPGHGDAGVDSHHELPVLDLPPDRFEAVEFEPFRAAVDADVAFLMLGHLLVPAFDDENPASLSPAIVEHLVRGRLGFSGVICTDDMDMKAISGSRTIGRAAVQAVAAGVDIVLACGTDHDQHAGIMEALIHAAEQGDIRPTALADAQQRQRRAKERFLPPAPRRPLPATQLDLVLRTPEHVAVAEAMARFA
jgi:beta-N-acetylhexosaminidase